MCARAPWFACCTCNLCACAHVLVCWRKPAYSVLMSMQGLLLLMLYSVLMSMQGLLLLMLYSVLMSMQGLAADAFK